jgi:hypothetical protein
MWWWSVYLCREEGTMEFRGKVAWVRGCSPGLESDIILFLLLQATT